nr:putative amidase [uncultured bacterium]
MGAIVEFVDPGFEDVTEVIETLWYGGAANIVSKIEVPLRSELDPGLLRVAEIGRKIGVVDYLRAVDRRNELSQLMGAFFRKWDLLLSPAVAITAFEAGHDVPAGSDSETWFSWSPYCHPFNLTQQPAISIPFGKNHDGMPIGIQLAGPRFRDDLVLSVADAILRNHQPAVLLEVLQPNS